MEYAKKELKVVFLELKWEDTISYVIQEGDLVQCARFIHQARTSGGSVLVHCAQVHYIKILVHFIMINTNQQPYNTVLTHDCIHLCE